MPLVALAAVLFTWREWVAVQPFIDVKAVASNRALSATLVRALLTYTAFYCVFFGIPQWLQYVKGMGAADAGSVMLPMAAVGVAATVFGSRVYGRGGARPTMVIGTAALVVGGAALAFIARSDAPTVLLLLLVAIFGIPLGFNNIGQ